MTNNDVNNQIKINGLFGLYRYIVVVFGVILLSTWTLKSASLENLTQYEFQQDLYKEITGIVKTEQGDPIPGVVVKLAGTNVETVTDAEGRYKFNVKKGEKIQFVFEGFKTVMFTVSQSNVLNIAMVEDDTDTTFSVIEDIYRTMVKDRMAHGNNVSSDIIVKRRQDSIFKEITGIVKTEEGDPIPGVVILKLGTNQGTETDIEGKYSLNANEGDKISFYIEGFKTTTVTVNQSGVLNITLVKDEDILSDMVVDKYRTLSKEDRIKYGITSREFESGYPSLWSREMLVFNANSQHLNIATESKAKTVTTTPKIGCGYSHRYSLKELLQGQMISLDFSKRYNPSERNPETILKDVENLTRNGNYTYIVDGVRVSEETFRSINQNDVESVDIYKHTDVYNARFGSKENQSRITLEAR